MKKVYRLEKIAMHLTDHLTKLTCDLMRVHQKISGLTEEEMHRVFIVGTSFFLANIASGVQHMDPDTWIDEFCKMMKTDKTLRTHLQVKRKNFLTAVRKETIKGVPTT